jgi:hypothetical protein
LTIKQTTPGFPFDALRECDIEQPRFVNVPRRPSSTRSLRGSWSRRRR